jgi:hypothetical protein
MEYIETKKARRPMTQRKKPARGSSLRWKGRSGSPICRIAEVLDPYCTARTPATTAARDATAVMVKDRCMVNRRDLAQQGARMTGENMRNMDIMAISKAGIN